MQDLKITLIQSDLHWQDPIANRAMFEEKIWSIDEPTDLIILPEMFTTGFTMNAEKHAEPVNHTSYKWMKQMAAQKNAVITGSVIIKDQNKFYNRLLWVEPSGDISSYDKRHLFRMAEENNVFAAGESKIIKLIHGWKICPLICYDLRFPVWSRNVNFEYDLLLYVANWPKVRSLPWKVLLQARAIENLAYVAGVNRVMEDGNGIQYSGDSSLINFKGEIIYTAADIEKIETITLNYKELEAFRKKFPAHLDADSFHIDTL